jgi:hypothetical protein
MSRKLSRDFVARLSLVCGILCLLLCGRAQGGSFLLAWNPSPPNESWLVAGYHVYYGPASYTYTNTIDAGTNWFISLDNLDPGATYFFSVTAYDDNGLDGPDSNQISLTTPFPPIIISQPSSQIAQAGATATMFVNVVGTPPVSFQWYENGLPIRGRTNSILRLRQIIDGDEGDYTAVITDSEGSVTTAVASVTVIDPPPAPLIPTNIVDTTTNSGSGSQPASVSGGGSDTGSNGNTPPAFAAGTYNGLFYQTNSDGTPAFDVQTTGSISQCAVDSLGNFTAQIYLDGVTNSITGTFNASGNDTIIVDRSAEGVSNLDISLNLNSAPGAPQISGVVSNLDSNNPWTAALSAELQTNASNPSLNLLLNVPGPAGLPAASAMASVIGGTVQLFGTLGDGSILSQSLPISIDGTIPLLIPLYQNAGLLAGWLNISTIPATSPLTWICPPGQINSGFTNVVNVAIFNGL